MIYKEVRTSSLAWKRHKSMVFAFIAILCCNCNLLFAQKTCATADTAALHQQIAALQAQPSLHHDSIMARLSTLNRRSIQANYQYGIIKTLQSMALTAGQAGKLDDCRRYSREGITWARRDTSAEGQHALTFFYNQLANCDHKEGLYASAAGWYYASWLAAIRCGAPVALIGVYTNIGALMNDVRKPQNALYYLQRAIQLARDGHLNRELGNALVNKAIACDYMKQRDSCLAAYLEAIAIARRTGNNPLLITALYGLGNTYVDLKQPEKALYYGRMSVQLTTGEGDIYNRMFAYYVVGNAYAALQHNDSAVYYLEKFMSIAQNLGLGRYESEAHKSLGRLYYKAGLMTRAADQMAIYINNQDSLLNIEMEQQSAEIQARYRAAEQEKQLIQKELLLARKENDIRKGNMYIIIICIIALLTVSALYLKYRNLHKHRLEKLRQAKQSEQMDQLRAMIDVEEKERRRIARELHDDIGGMLTIVRMRFDALRKEKEQGKTLDKKDLEEVSRLLDQASYGLRGTAHRLLPDIIMRHQLPEIMRLLAEQIQHSGQLAITVQHMGEFDVFEHDTDFKLNIYRIVQELVSNILKHAQATEAMIELRHINQMFEITVEDNGKGYDATKSQAGIGLENVRMRVNYLGGEISIEAKPGTGTSVYIHIDFTQQPKKNATPHAHTGFHS